ncbi:MAG: DPP IV N-terminal domain-containing protein [Anaerolineaceae bacterium]|nr:DPP IV N-terminal domain-containing protein [Anaerolineaceae bacterium]
MENMKQLSWDAYARAESFLPLNIKKRVFNDQVKPVWLPEGEEFWYVRKSSNGETFILVDPENDEKKIAFDHQKMAAAVSIATGKACTANTLPFSTIEWVDGSTKLRFDVGEKSFECDLNTYQLQEVQPEVKLPPDYLVSPDGKQAVFIRDFNVFLKDIESGDEKQLTHDGQQYFDYGGSPECNTLGVTLKRLKVPLPPMALWSPDSKKLLTQRLDQRDVKELHLLQSVPPQGQRPQLHSYRYPMPGDEHLVKGEVVIIEVEKGEVIIPDLGHLDLDILGFIEGRGLWWGEGSNTAYLLQSERGHKRIRLFEIEADNGKSRQLFEETGNTFLEAVPFLGAQPNVRIIDKGTKFIWYSERDGWANLYLYDLEKSELINPITTGEFVVYSLEYVDEAEQRLYFMAGAHEDARDPYYQHLYRVKLDGSDLELLTPEDAFHQVTFSRSGAYFIDCYSTVKEPPVVLLKKKNGEVVRKLEEADTSHLVNLDWFPPEPFKVKAKDGITDIFGVIYRPSNFEPGSLYPVIDSIYPGPQHIRSPKGFLESEHNNDQALAELGFIVVSIDGLGNIGRDKAHHDLSYGNFQDPGDLESHIYGLRQLAERYTYMDLSRVGIYGHSGGGFASTKAILKYPDFYKVAVSSAGNHDQRGYLAGWGELYNGLMDGDNYLEQANINLAANLRGHLLLVHGDMDDNVHPALTMQVADALIKANKDFDMLILPNEAHRFVVYQPYFLRRLWDYFVRHLAEMTPPKEYVIDPQSLPPLDLSALFG